MAKAKSKSKPKTTKKKLSFKKPSLKLTSQQKLIFGSLLVLLGVLIFIAFLSFLFTGKADQSVLGEFPSRVVETQNWASQSGAWVSDFFIQRGFGIASFIFAGLMFISGIYILLDLKKEKLFQHWFWGTLITIWISILLGFIIPKVGVLSGTIGFELNNFLQDYIGKIGVVLLLLFGLITYLAIRFGFTPERIGSLLRSAKKDIKTELQEASNAISVPIDNALSDEAEAIKSAFQVTEDLQPTISNHSKIEDSTSATALKVETPKIIKPSDSTSTMEIEIPEDEPEVEIEIKKVIEEKSETDNLSDKLVADFGQFDPTLELSNYQFPPLDLLK